MSPKIHESVRIAPGAQVVGDVVLEESVSIWYNAVLRGDEEQIYVGPRTNIQENCVLHGTSVTVGADVTVGHGAILHGCVVEDLCVIGMGAIVLDGARIGKGSMIGAGALVTSNTQIPPHSLVVGSPAKVIRQIPEQLDYIRKHAEVNWEHAQQFLPAKD